MRWRYVLQMLDIVEYSLDFKKENATIIEIVCYRLGGEESPHA